MFIKNIREHQRGLVFKRGNFSGLLKPGRYLTLSPMLLGTRVELASTLTIRFTHPLLELIVRDPTIRSELEVVQLTDRQRGLLWIDGRLVEILGAGLHVFWRAPHDIKVDVLEVGEDRLEHENLDLILGLDASRQHLVVLQADRFEEMIVLRDGRVIDRVRGGGRAAYWRQSGELTYKGIDLREQTTEVASQDIITRDKVTLRLSLVVTWQVADVDAVTEKVADHTVALYRQAQLVLRKAVASRTLDTLLQEKDTVDSEVETALAERARELGIEVRTVGIRDVILPGDMKDILNRVITAEKEAQANLIRRREETAAARSQANTAKLLADNPILARLKELELVQEILAGAETKIVLGERNIVDGLRGLVSKEGG